MSRTDKDRPYFVKQQDETLGPYVRHRHTGGRCVVEIPEPGPRPSRWRHHRRCAKYSYITIFCERPRHISLLEPGCWHRIIDSENRRIVVVPCRGHERRVYDESTPCVCDDFDFPTCYIELPGERYGSRPPRWFVKARWNGPERARERAQLGEAAKLANAGEVEDFDFPNFQARHGAWWDWM